MNVNARVVRGLSRVLVAAMVVILCTLAAARADTPVVTGKVGEDGYDTLGTTEITSATSSKPLVVEVDKPNYNGLTGQWGVGFKCKGDGAAVVTYTRKDGTKGFFVVMCGAGPKSGYVGDKGLGDTTQVTATVGEETTKRLPGMQYPIDEGSHSDGKLEANRNLNGDVVIKGDKPGVLVYPYVYTNAKKDAKDIDVYVGVLIVTFEEKKPAAPLGPVNPTAPISLPIKDKD